MSMSFDVDDRLGAFIDAQVAEGHYETAADVVRAALRLLEAREARLAALRGALIEGETSGPATPFDFDLFIAAKGTAG